MSPAKLGPILAKTGVKTTFGAFPILDFTLVILCSSSWSVICFICFILIRKIKVVKAAHWSCWRLNSALGWIRRGRWQSWPSCVAPKARSWRQRGQSGVPRCRRRSSAGRRTSSTPLHGAVANIVPDIIWQCTFEPFIVIILIPQSESTFLAGSVVAFHIRLELRTKDVDSHIIVRCSCWNFQTSGPSTGLAKKFEISFKTLTRLTIRLQIVPPRLVTTGMTSQMRHNSSPNASAMFWLVWAQGLANCFKNTISLPLIFHTAHASGHWSFENFGFGHVVSVLGRSGSSSLFSSALSGRWCFSRLFGVHLRFLTDVKLGSGDFISLLLLFGWRSRIVGSPHRFLRVRVLGGGNFRSKGKAAIRLQRLSFTSVLLCWVKGRCNDRFSFKTDLNVVNFIITGSSKKQRCFFTIGFATGELQIGEASRLEFGENRLMAPGTWHTNDAPSFDTAFALCFRSAGQTDSEVFPTSCNPKVTSFCMNSAGILRPLLVNIPFHPFDVACWYIRLIPAQGLNEPWFLARKGEQGVDCSMLHTEQSSNQGFSSSFWGFKLPSPSVPDFPLQGCRQIGLQPLVRCRRWVLRNAVPFVAIMIAGFSGNSKHHCLGHLRGGLYTTDCSL